MNREHEPDETRPDLQDRRGFLSTSSSIGMAAGLAVSYGTFGAYSVRFLYPPEQRTDHWVFVAAMKDWPVGDAREFRVPGGEAVVVTRQSAAETIDDFVALSSTCPHLGCKVHWEQANQRFFCPCHNGAFDRSGAPLSGPPAEDDQSLPQYELKLENDLLYMLIPRFA